MVLLKRKEKVYETIFGWHFRNEFVCISVCDVNTAFLSDSTIAFWFTAVKIFS